MNSLIPGMVIGFREGLEAFLLVAIALRFLEKSGRSTLRASVWIGAAAGIITSALLGLALFAIALPTGSAGTTAKLWESGASLAALVLVTTFIVWMIRHGSKLGSAVETKLSDKTTHSRVGIIVFAMVLREGVEIALFSFAGDYPSAGIAIGVVGALILVCVVFLSLVKVNLATIFNLTLAYLILQAGFLFGYGIHEGLSALKDAGIIAASHPIFNKAFDFSKTALDHKDGIIGIPLYALFGWYSRPEWIQAAVQYMYATALFAYWFVYRKRSNKGV